jgi:hypothetical protein
MNNFKKIMKNKVKVSKKFQEKIKLSLQISIYKLINYKM